MTKYFFQFFICFASVCTFAQSQDALLWNSLSFEGKLNKDFNFELNNQYRFDNNASQLSSAFIEGTVDYELGKLFKIAAGYRLANRRGADNYSLRHRLYSDLNFDYEIIDDFDIELRFRIQHDFDRLQALNDYIFPVFRTLARFRYGFEYNIKNWKPSVSNELFFNLQEASFSRYRVNFGLGYKISKRHSIKLGYTLQHRFNDVISNEHIYKIGYTYNLKGKLLK